MPLIINAQVLATKFKTTNSIPMYEKNIIFKDYRINQPIKGAISCVMAFEAFNSALEFKNLFSEKVYRFNAIYLPENILYHFYLGSAIGIYKGFRYTKMKKNNPNFHLSKNKIGFEEMISTNIATTTEDNKFSLCKTFTYSHKLYFIDEFKFGINKTAWYKASNDYRFNELKANLSGLHYSNDGKFFSQFVGGGIGLSKANIIKDYSSSNSYETILKPAMYPYFNVLGGLKFNFLDFFYVNLQADFELSSFYFKSQKYVKFPFTQNLTLGFSLGTKIF